MREEEEAVEGKELTIATGGAADLKTEERMRCLILGETGEDLIPRAEEGRDLRVLDLDTEQQSVNIT